MSEAERERVENVDVAYEKRDVNVRYIAWVGVAILVSAILIHFAVGLLQSYLSAHETRSEKKRVSLIDVKREPPPEPRLQVDPEADLRQMRLSEDATLQSYGWVDRQKGIVRIPIEHAMTLLAERGLPTPQGQASTSTQVDQSIPDNGKKSSGATSGKGTRGRRAK